MSQDVILVKVCTKCGEEKSLSNFTSKKTAKDGLKPMCSPCEVARVTEWRQNNLERDRTNKRNWTYKKLYGITPEQYDEMQQVQKGLCMICEKEPVERLCVDHDHTTLRVRGLLCRRCNAAIGLLEEDIKLLQSMINYIRRYQ